MRYLSAMVMLMIKSEYCNLQVSSCRLHFSRGLSPLQMFVELHEEVCKAVISFFLVVDIAKFSLPEVSK